MTKEIKTEITINANPETIWNILIHQETYPDWNPFIKKLEGKLEIGNKIEVVIQPENASKMTFKPKILKFEPNKTLQWKGIFLMKGLFDGTHTLKLTDNKNGTTTFKHTELFKGVLVKFFNLENTRKGFEKMNSELKRLSENSK
ncbi:SRPBCC domain-containing protein [Aestuariibaculum sediminum]|uniref:SRPBCC domain-containing protein n=1 Tax=Aestuariibaculum sediminum TaxID=2770637 RepID=A0A8J6U6G0_9FLAO|nr:SRPBCC domain-containing protein [Aestuariibaculum sediminum]MBD0830745.1 SRPBCC domain-containing protein [Aestuariibaculum sediminum]